MTKTIAPINGVPRLKYADTTPTTPTVADLLNLAGKTVLVTGASGSIGSGISARLAEAGANIVVHYHRNEVWARQLALNVGGVVMQADLSNDDDVARLFAAGRADLVVNNAAIQAVRDLVAITTDEWRDMQRVTLDSAFLVSQCAAKQWQIAKTGGAIVNIASIEGSDPAAGHCHYATAKAALLMFTRSAALEYGPAGIRVNAVSPGLIHRSGIEKNWPDGVARWLDRAPLGRLGTPNDVADAVLFLLSPAARWISGANLAVDGGMSAQSRW